MMACRRWRAGRLPPVLLSVALLAGCGSTTTNGPAAAGDVILLAADGAHTFTLQAGGLYSAAVASRTEDCDSTGAALRSEAGQLVAVAPASGAGPVNAGAGLPGAIASEPAAPAPLVGGLGVRISVFLDAGTWHVLPPHCANWTVTLTRDPHG
jgi:hypothetical protein